MRHPRWLLLIVAAFYLAASPLVHADKEHSPSHVPLPPGPGGSDPETLFKDRLNKAKLLHKLNPLIKDQLKGESLEDLMKHLKQQGIDPTKPEFEKYIRDQLAKQPSDQKLTDEELDTLKRLFKAAFTDAKKKEDPLTKVIPDPKDKVLDPTVKPPVPDPDSKKPGTPVSPEEKAAQEAAQAQTTRQLLQWAKNLDGLAGNINDSPALKNTLQDLSRLALKQADAPRGTADQTFNDRLAKLNRYASEGKNLFGKKSSGGPKFDLPAVSSLSLPELRLSWGGSAPNVRMPSGVSAASNPGSWAGLLWIVFAVCAAVLLWKLWKWTGPFAKRGPDDGWQLGPWPLSPASVRSREELVRTFEYLSLLLLGRQARHWHHLEIAGRLGGEEAERRQAAGKLAALYEQARYTPADEPLTEEALAAYRRDLCFLAGIAAS